jgi:hypothetical protein
MEELKDSARMIKLSHRDPHGRHQLTMVNSLRERDWHTMYPGSRPLGGGSLHSASNQVYDLNGVYSELLEADLCI